MGLLTRLALYGEPDIPRDRVLLNLGDELENWHRQLSKRVHAREKNDESN